MTKSSLKTRNIGAADCKSAAATTVTPAADYKSAAAMSAAAMSAVATSTAATSTAAADLQSAAIKTAIPAADLTLTQRVMAPTPKFFKTLRTIGLVIGLVGGAILASPLALPAAVVTVGGYLALAGSIVTGVSQTAVNKE